ncbi:FHA domain-containing protein [Nannocystaceae bacterium ST9]
MGSIKHAVTGEDRMLPEHAVLGRSPNCDIVIRSSKASAEHAVLRWTKGGWRVVDLASSNGTWVAGKKLAAGESSELELDSPVSFGSMAETWVLSSAEPPEPFVRGEDRDLPIVDGLLALPSEDDPRLTIGYDAGEWFAEHEGGRQPVEDRERLRISGRWQLFLPVRTLPQTEAESGRVCDAELIVRHDPTEEHVTAQLEPRSGPPVDLGHHAHHVVLLELGRILLEDRARGVDPEREGWVHSGDLSQRVGADVTHLNIMIHRLRRQLATAGILDSANIVERQRRTGMLRVGPRSVRVIRG